MSTLFSFGFKRDASQGTSSQSATSTPSSKSSTKKDPSSTNKKDPPSANKRTNSPNKDEDQAASQNVIGKRANGVAGSKRARLATPSKNKGKPSKPTKSPKKYADNPDIPEDAVGRRVEIYWPNDKEWYAGVIKSNANSIGKHHIVYDDETEETISLSKERFRWEQSDNETKDTNQKPVEIKNGRITRRLRLKRPVDEGSDEEEFVLSDENDSESNYEEDASSSDEEEVVSVVEEEEEEQVKVVKKTPRKAKSAKLATMSTPKSKSKSTVSNVTTTPREVAPSGSFTTPIRSTTPMTGGFGSSPWTPSASRGTPGGTSSPTQGGRVGALPYGDHEHHHLKWLNQDLRDARQCKYGQPDYDPTTLFVPRGYLDGRAEYHATNTGKARKITPAMRIWWEFKSRCFDCVLFFKVGKFYELYHMDADVAVQHLNLLYMKGDAAHCGFPEISYGKFSERLVQRGYRVARVEQTETPAEMKQRTGKSSGCVSREICSVLSPGTRTLSFRDGRGSLCETDSGVERLQLLALAETPIPVQEGTAKPGPDDKSVLFGVSILDPTTGKFRIGHFTDNSHRFNLRTLLAQERAAEIVFVRTNLSENTMSVLRYEAPERSSSNPTLYTILPFTGPRTSIEDASSDTSNNLSCEGENSYFADDTSRPSAITTRLESSSANSLESQVALAAFGFGLTVLKRAHIDHELVSFGNIKEYVHPGMQDFTKAQDHVAAVEQEIDEENVTRMVLDGQALANLEVLECSNENAPLEGSLFGFLNKCVTNFGARRLKGWIAAPLFSVPAILRRQNLVASFVTLIEAARTNGLEDLTGNFRTALRKVPDLERLLARIHALGLKRSKASHPDAAAVLYENDKYNKTKIGGLISALNGLGILQSAFKDFAARIQKCELTGTDKEQVMNVVIPLVQFGKGKMEDIKDDLDFFSRLFNHAKAKQDGCILPEEGEWAPYDDCRARIRDVKEHLNQILREEQSKLGLGKIKFYLPKQGRDLYQLEVPADLLKSAKAPSHWTLKSQSKQFKRYYTKPIIKLVEQLAALELELESTRSDFTRGVFEQFDLRCAKWSGIVNCASECDALISLALVSANSSDDAPMVRPTILPPPPSLQQRAGYNVYLHLKESRHPCVAALMEKQGQGAFISNDITLGRPPKASDSGNGEDVAMGDASVPSAGECLLLTGPNMGGKSTLLRQSCIAVIMAQIGCFVPASECIMTPVDRVFTRVGASDRIMAGHSTFFVELSETTSILKSATCNSLTILDELGRGTSTFDGTAIAYAVVKELCRIGCRFLFATHYHSLVHEFEDGKHKAQVSLGHMSCYAEEQPEAAEKPKVADTMVTFLYKLADGASDKSYGLNVARLAKLPPNVIQRAHEKSEEFEESLNDSITPSTIFNQVSKVLKATSNTEQQHEQLVALWKRASKLTISD